MLPNISFIIFNIKLIIVNWENQQLTCIVRWRHSYFILSELINLIIDGDMNYYYYCYKNYYTTRIIITLHYKLLAMVSQLA